MLKDAPDLQGIAFVAAAPKAALPADASAPQQPSGMDEGHLLLRLDFLGHVSIERMHAHWTPAISAAPPAQLRVSCHSATTLLIDPVIHEDLMCLPLLSSMMGAYGLVYTLKAGSGK